MPNKKLILKSPSPASPYSRQQEVVLVGGQYDGWRVRVDPNERNIQYGAEVYSRVIIEDERGHKIDFYRSVNLTDIQAINMAIIHYKKQV